MALHEIIAHGLVWISLNNGTHWVGQSEFYTIDGQPQTTRYLRYWWHERYIERNFEETITIPDFESDDNLPLPEYINRGRAKLENNKLTIQWYTEPTADWDFSKTFNVQDIHEFLKDWFSSSPYCDLDRTGNVDSRDVFMFLRMWFNSQ